MPCHCETDTVSLVALTLLWTMQYMCCSRRGFLRTKPVRSTALETLCPRKQRRSGPRRTSVHRKKPRGRGGGAERRREGEDPGGGAYFRGRGDAVLPLTFGGGGLRHLATQQSQNLRSSFVIPPRSVRVRRGATSHKMPPPLFAHERAAISPSRPRRAALSNA